MPPRRKHPNPPAPAAAPAPSKPKKYESTPVPKQLTFPPRHKTVRTYGPRRSLPAELETTTTTGNHDETTPASGKRATRRSMRQATLTQIDYVRSFSGSGEEMEGVGGLRDEVEDEEEDEDGDVDMVGETKAETETVTTTARVTTRKTSERRSKRRKTTGDVPVEPKLERKGSSFKTQTLTQFLPEVFGGEREELRLDDEDDDDEPVKGEDDEAGNMSAQPLGNRNTRRAKAAPPKRGKGKIKADPDPATDLPQTPSKRIRDVYEVPSSQPTPLTPFNGYSPIPPQRSPLAQKSQNFENAPRLPTGDTTEMASPTITTTTTTSKLPRTLVIQDSYSMGGDSSPVLPSSSLPAVAATPTHPRSRPQTQSQRQPLSEIPVASLELGVGSTPPDETQSARRKRMFVEIPDSDDDLESVGSTPLAARSVRSVRSARQASMVQRTPVRRGLERVQEGEGLGIAADPGSAGPGKVGESRGSMVAETPASGRSDKENETPRIEVLEDSEEEGNEGEGDEPGTPTPRLDRRSQAASRTSQVSPNTASQFWTASAEDAGRSSAPAMRELAVLEEVPVIAEPEVSSSPRISQFHGSMGASAGRSRRSTPQLDSEETASEAEDEGPQVVDLTDETPRRTSQVADKGKHRATPEVSTESSTDGMPGTPTPVVRKVVQIEEPQPSIDEEMCKETPRRPRRLPRSSPLYPRQTQPRSQRYSQRFESQRVSLDVIRSLGPQTDRSDILISMDPDIVEEILDGKRDHEFRTYRFPPQVSRCWIYETDPVNEIRYMVTVGPAQEPGQIPNNTGVGNAEFNAGTSGFLFAHELRQVYVLNNPIPREDMEDNDLGDGPPLRYRYVPPAVVGDMMGNLNRAWFVEGEEEENHPMTVSQELEEQIRSDIIHSTQRPGTRMEVFEEDEEDDIIPASQSPLKHRQVQQNPAPAGPTRSSQRFHGQPGHAETVTTTEAVLSRPASQPKQLHRQQQPRRNKTPVRPSQATTASNLSSSPERHTMMTTKPSSPASATMLSKSSHVSRHGLAKHQSGNMDDESEEETEDSLGLRLPTTGGGGTGGEKRQEQSSASESAAATVGESMLPSSMLLPPDSLLLEEVGMAPPPVEVWDSEDEREQKRMIGDGWRV
ncbi:hypothetical protein VTJ49DRAFT_4805 [Mycothermus thermophilus]|uniref:Uncharacterized protein n=1 Tax=Humicola insolens TaxID=85995 RepID=A0ABR3V4X0_HUMIN